MTTVISVENLSKSYRLGQIGTGTFASDLQVWWAKMRGKPNPLLKIGETDHGNRDGEELWALKDVSFDVKQGEVLGIIGRNGAGKSTLLKILSRVTAPTSGKIKVKGRIASLLEVGTGFHPELTGRENIYLNGAILGMSKQEVARKFDEIVDFSGVEKFIDTPVKRYSSGMYVRLAFAVAAHLEPEILVVDEVLAVGDAEFQKKCLGKMGEVAHEGRTVLFVSHNMAAVSSLCSKAVFLRQGQVLKVDDVQPVIEAYYQSFRGQSNFPLNERQDRSGDQQLRLTEISFAVDDRPSDSLISGRDATFFVDYRALDIVKSVRLSIGIYNIQGQFLLMCNNEMTGVELHNLPRHGKISCKLNRFPLSPGKYTINLYCEANGVLADWVQEAANLDVMEGDFFGTGKLSPLSHGGILVDQVWRFL